MPIRMLLRRNTYYDSITLMSIARTLKELPGVEDAGAVMATSLNCELLSNSRLLPTFNERDAQPGPEDLLIAVRTSNESQAEAALTFAEQFLTAYREREMPEKNIIPVARSLEMALRRDAEAQLAVISVAGQHAWLEAEMALKRGMHVFLFSDNVPIGQERRLKELAVSKNLLLMGPDCGTALLNCIGLGFCNVVPRGNIGIVGASGTGMQQVMCLIAAAGLGISQAIGTGGRDLSEEIDGIMMRSAFNLLANDPSTEIIILVAKSPARRVAQEILTHAQIDKPVIAIFLGAGQFSPLAGKVQIAKTLTEGAELAVELAGADSTRVPNASKLLIDESQRASERTKLAPTQRYIRALYSGGTLCNEAMLLLSKSVESITSNVPLYPQWALNTGEIYRGHTALDLGADEFTHGRPHPMIDPTLCLPYLTHAAEDPETAVILLDIVLGFCAHPDPASIFAPAIHQIRARAADHGYALPIIVSLCGTDEDPQHFSTQRTALEAVGAFVYASNVAATLAATSFVQEISR